MLGGLNDTTDEVIATIGVPKFGTLYQGALCLGHEVRELEPVMNPHTGQPGVLYEVVGDFDNDISADDADEKDTPPENRRAVVNWDAELEEELLEKDAITGAAIQTSANEPILITGPVLIHTLEITPLRDLALRSLDQFSLWRPAQQRRILRRAGRDCLAAADRRRGDDRGDPLRACDLPGEVQDEARPRESQPVLE